jgi:ubiquinone/menaquinone biosynthesis C-methylase UbiE
MQRVGIYKILSIPKVYSFIQWLFYDSRTASYFQELIGVTEEKKILDVGCGPGDWVLKFPNSEYVGIDISQEYIDNANNRFGKLGRFYCVSVDEIEKIDITKIDIVIIKAVLHHLSDEQISGMLEKLKNVMNPGGVLITLDCAFFPKQNPISRMLVSLDRGMFVREVDHYRAVLRKSSLKEIESKRIYQKFPPYDRLLMKFQKI